MSRSTNCPILLSDKLLTSWTNCDLRFDEVLIDQDSDFEEVWEMRETQAVYASISADLISDHVSSGLDLTAAQERVELESEFYLHDPITGPLVTDPATPRGRQMANQ